MFAALLSKSFKFDNMSQVTQNTILKNRIVIDKKMKRFSSYCRMDAEYTVTTVARTRA